MSLTDVGENFMLDWLVGRAALPSFSGTAGALGLFLVPPTDLGETDHEVTGSGYTRLPITNFAAGFPTAANGMNTNNADILFAASPPSDWGAVNAIQMMGNVTPAGGSLGWYAIWNVQLQGVAQCLAGVPVKIPKGAISMRMAAGCILSRPTANQLLEWALKGTGQSQMTVKLGLMTTPPNADGTGGVEVNGGNSTNGYSRATAANYFTASAAVGQIANVLEIPFGTPTASWGDANYICAFNGTGTTALWTLPIPTKTLNNCGPVKIPAGALVLTGD